MTTLYSIAAVGLAAPLMLLGGLLIALPIAAHLLNRRTTRRLIFPSVELLAASAASQSGLFRLRRLILLCLRIMVVLLIVLAFAMPLWSKGPAGSSAGGKGKAVVIVIDRSLSTRLPSGPVSAIKSLRAQGGEVLSQLSPGTDRVSVVYADAHPQAALPAMSANFDLLRRGLDGVTATQQRADFEAALALGADILAREGGGRATQLVVVSDLQETNWAGVDVASALGALPEGTAVTLMPIEGDVAENVSVHQLRVSPATPVVGQSVFLRGQLNSDARQARTIEVALWVDGRQVQTQTVKIEPGERREFAFAHAFDSLGDHRVAVSISDDALREDNVAHLAVRLHERVPVLVLADADPGSAGGDSYFLIRAVAPRGGGADRYAARHLTSQQAPAGQLDGAAAVLVGDVQTLRGAMLEALRAYMDAGGGVVLFCNDAPAFERIAQLVDSADGGELPWASMRRRDLSAQGQWTTLGEGDWRSALLRDFDLPSQEALNEIAFRTIWEAESVHPSTRVLLRFQDGHPAIAQVPVGRGQLIVCNFSPSLSSSDLGKYGSFIALVQAMVGGLTPPASAGLPRHPGDAVVFSNITGYDASAGPLRVLGADGAAITDAVFHTQGDQPIASIHRADHAGFYEVRQGDQRLALAAVDVDPREGDPRRLDIDALMKQFDQAGIDAKAGGASAGIGALVSDGRPLWGWVIVLALAALSLEMLALAYFRGGTR